MEVLGAGYTVAAGFWDEPCLQQMYDPRQDATYVWFGKQKQQEDDDIQEVETEDANVVMLSEEVEGSQKWVGFKVCGASRFVSACGGEN